MWEEANCNSKAQRVVLRYLRTTFGKRAIEIPDGSRRDLNTSLENIWTKPLNKALNVSMATRLFNRKERVKKTIKLDNIDLVFGGDHGQRRFQMMVKVIARNSCMTCIDEWPIKGLELGLAYRL